MRSLAGGRVCRPGRHADAVSLFVASGWRSRPWSTVVPLSLALCAALAPRVEAQEPLVAWPSISLDQRGAAVSRMATPKTAPRLPGLNGAERAVESAAADAYEANPGGLARYHIIGGGP